MSPIASYFSRELKPRSFDLFARGYKAADLRRDLFSGITVGIVALPLAMAFSIAAGGSPEQGLVTAIVAGFLISFLGGSRYQIGGPTGAFVVIIAGIMARHGFSGLVAATLIAGCLLVIMGATGIGRLIRYIPRPVTIGFTAGIGVIIAAGQLKDFLGLAIAHQESEFVAKIVQIAESAGSLRIEALALGAGTIAVILLMRRFAPKLPAAFTGVLAASLASLALGLPVATIGSTFGEVRAAFPAPSMPAFGWAELQAVFPDAVTIALLAAIESLLSAVVADGMTGDRHKPNCELVAQGLANIGSALFGGIPATGAIARTATNIKAGARSPVSGMVHAVVVLAFLLFLSPYAAVIPLASLAGVLLVVAWDMSELKHFIAMFRSTKSDLAVMLVAFILTVLIDLTLAVQAGVVLACLLFMRRMAEETKLGAGGLVITKDGIEVDSREGVHDERLDVPKGCEVYEIIGPFFFGAAELLKDTLATLDHLPPVIVLRMRNVSSLDASGIAALGDFNKRVKAAGSALVLSGLHSQPWKLLEKTGMAESIGKENLCKDIGAALERARTLLEA